jgi:hypothetical protein
MENCLHDIDRLAVLAQNAAQFAQSDLDDMFKNFLGFLSMSEINRRRSD